MRVVPGRCPSLSHLSPLGTCVRKEVDEIIRSCSFAARVAMTNTVKLLNVVALTVALPEYNLRRGQVGTVVEILAEGNALESVRISGSLSGFQISWRRNARFL